MLLELWTETVTQLLLLACAKSHMLSASRRQPHLLHVSAVDRRQTWSMNKSWRCLTLSGFLHSHIVRCRWNPISCGTHYSGPGLSENDSAVTTDVCEDQNLEVGLWGLPLKWNWPPLQILQWMVHRWGSRSVTCSKENEWICPVQDCRIMCCTGGEIQVYAECPWLTAC